MVTRKHLPTSVGVSPLESPHRPQSPPTRKHLPASVGVSRQIQDAQLVGIGSQSTPHSGGGFSLMTLERNGLVIPSQRPPHLGGGYSRRLRHACARDFPSQSTPHFDGGFSQREPLATALNDSQSPPHFGGGFSVNAHATARQQLIIANTSPLRWGFLQVIKMEYCALRGSSQTPPHPPWAFLQTQQPSPTPVGVAPVARSPHSGGGFS
jgi:hypothetical protein